MYARNKLLVTKLASLSCLSGLLVACGGGSSDSTIAAPQIPVVVSPAPQQINTHLIVTIGDSLTAGWHNKDGKLQYLPADSYPSILQNILGKEYTVHNYAVGGKTSQQILVEQLPLALAEHPGSILVTAGINDIKYGIDNYSYSYNIGQISTRANAQGARVYFISSSYWPDFDSDVLKYNGSELQLSKLRSDTYVSTRALDTSQWFCGATDIPPDYHPCLAGNTAIATLVAATILNNK